jgi:hypothetical protein
MRFGDVDNIYGYRFQNDGTDECTLWTDNLEFMKDSFVHFDKLFDFPCDAYLKGLILRCLHYVYYAHGFGFMITWLLVYGTFVAGNIMCGCIVFGYSKP